MATNEQMRRCWDKNRDKYNAQRRARRAAMREQAGKAPRAKRIDPDDRVRKEQELKAHNNFMRSWLIKPWRVSA